MKPSVMVTGATGLIGYYLVKNAARWVPGWSVRGIGRTDLDLTDSTAVENVYQQINPRAVIHCAALSRTKDCEQDPQRARRINVDVTAHLAHLAENIPFLFVSSGEVFDGQRGWYQEEDEPNPINVYGHTKLEAEQRVVHNPRHSVVRIVLTAGASQQGNRSFVEEMCRVARNGQRMTLYGDEFRCPLPAGAIARAIWELLARDVPGLYHLGGRERLSRWEIGQAVLPWYSELRDCLIEGSSRTHVGAPRPADLSLNCDKIQSLLSFPLPGFRQWLRDRNQQNADIWDYEPCLM